MTLPSRSPTSALCAAIAVLCAGAAPAADWAPTPGLTCARQTFTGPQIGPHLAYPDDPPTLRQNVCKNSNPASNALRPETADALKAMTDAAASDGVALKAISCYRAEVDQRRIFCGRIDSGAQTYGERMRWSAPPGYSEHRTGYVIDFTDPAAPACELETCFAETAAGRWLDQNATRFGFELSFPKDNAQGVGWEPWHWRYVGTPEARATFADARARFPADPGVPEPPAE